MRFAVVVAIFLSALPCGGVLNGFFVFCCPKGTTFFRHMQVFLGFFPSGFSLIMLGFSPCFCWVFLSVVVVPRWLVVVGVFTSFVVVVAPPPHPRHSPYGERRGASPPDARGLKARHSILFGKIKIRILSEKQNNLSVFQTNNKTLKICICRKKVVPLG